MRHLNGMKTRARLGQWSSVSVDFHSLKKRCYGVRRSVNETANEGVDYSERINSNWVKSQSLASYFRLD